MIRRSHRRRAALLVAAIATMAGAGPAVAHRAAPRIVGGSAVPISGAPWQVALVTAGETPYGGQFCGGTVVDATHVVTAAHCVSDAPTPARDLQVVAGATRLSRAGEPDPPTARRVGVARWDAHPRYDPNGVDHDAAVLTLAAPLWPVGTAPAAGDGSAIAPLPLTDVGVDPPAGTGLLLTGWGRTEAVDAGGDLDPSGRSPQDLRGVVVPLVDRARCARAYGRTLTDRMLCAGTAGRDSCLGDSGGPVASTAAPVRLVGIVSFSRGCADGDYPGVNTRVAAPTVGGFLRAAIGGTLPPDARGPRISFPLRPRATVSGTRATLRLPRYVLDEPAFERHVVEVAGRRAGRYAGVARSGRSAIALRLTGAARTAVRRAHARRRTVTVRWRIEAVDGVNRADPAPGHRSVRSRSWRIRP